MPTLAELEKLKASFQAEVEILNTQQPYTAARDARQYQLEGDIQRIEQDIRLLRAAEQLQLWR